MKEFATAIRARAEELSGAITFIEQSLIACKTSSKDKIKALLLAEEFLVEVFKHTSADESIAIKVRKFFGQTSVIMTAKGREAVTVVPVDAHTDFESYDSAPNAEAAIRSMIINANSDVLRQSYRNGTNKVVITAGVSSQRNLMYVLSSMLLAVVIGVLMRLMLSESVCNAVNNYVFMSVKTIFLNALKTVIAPLIFFSIAASVSSISDLSEFGRTGAKVMGFYATTTLAATIVALLSYRLINPGSFGELVYMIKGSGAAEGQGMVSILDTLIGIIPDNFFGAFVNSSTLQLIFLGILVGGVVPLMGEGTEKVASFLSTANELFLKIATAITKLLPIAVFAFIGSMVLTLDVQVLKTLLSLFICIFAGMLLMMVFYLMVVMVMTKSNPITFAKEVMPAWLNALALSSSNASMPFTMDTCEKKLGISPKLFSFSIPLGATINMDGFVIVLTIAFLFLAKVFGVELHGGDIGTLILTIILLSFGAPGMPGVTTICMSVLLLQFHIPMEALTVFIGIDALTDPLNTANNVLGDIVGTYCIGKRNGLMKEGK